MLRLCLDVNVWVNHYIAAARRPDRVSAAGGLARATFAGSCRIGPIQLVVSHAMLDTLEAVLRRLPVTAPFAEMARDQVEAAAGNGYLSQPPSVNLGGTAAYPLLDEEDAGILNTAMAGRSDLLVTNNIGDFVRGPRARTDTVTLSSKGGVPDVVRLDHPKLPGGLPIASPFQAAGWLLHARRPPLGVLADFMVPDEEPERP
jgi:predicted nucleic acid-binding protein